VISLKTYRLTYIRNCLVIYKEKHSYLQNCLGDAGKVDASRNEVYQKYHNIDKFKIDRYMIWVACQAIIADQSLSATDKAPLFIKNIKTN
jgi:hypothetical protein